MKGEKPKLVPIKGGFGKTPPAPSWLTSQAKAEWKRAAPELVKRKLLSQDVLATLEAYCTAAGQTREAEEIMAAEGRILETDKGKVMHPAFRMQQTSIREARLLAAELGLTPHRRVHTKEEKKTNDKWDASLLA